MLPGSVAVDAIRDVVCLYEIKCQKNFTSSIKHVRPMTPIKPQISFASVGLIGLGYNTVILYYIFFIFYYIIWGVGLADP